MSKLTHKLNEKTVGAASSRPHFGGIARKENAITLIALIITIIVMLILTGVTLGITLGDNGLVNKAKEASEQTEIAMDRELLLSAVVGAIGEDGLVNFTILDNNLPAGFSGSNGTYTSQNGHTFKVDFDGTITYLGEGNTENSSDDLELLRRYFLGEIDETTGERPGKAFTEMFENHDSIMEEGPLNGVLKGNEIIPDASNEISVVAYTSYMDIEGIYYGVMYVNYNSNYYKIDANAEDMLIKNVYSVKTTSSVDLSGTYYSNYSKDDYIIEDNTCTVDYRYGDSWNYSFAVYYDDENETVCFVDESAEGIQFGYELIYDNGVVVNKLLRIPDGQALAWQNTNGLEYEIEGIYLGNSPSSDGSNYRLVFNEESHTVDYQYSYRGGSWGYCTEGQGRIYFKYNGINYIDGRPIAVSEDLKTITYNDTTYIKQEN